MDEVAGLSGDSTGSPRREDLARIAGQVDRGLGDLKSGGFDVARSEERVLTGKTSRELMTAWAAQLPLYRKLGDGENPLVTRGPVNWEIAKEDVGRPGVVAEAAPVPWDKVLEGMDADIGQLDKDESGLGERAVRSSWLAGNWTH